MENLEAENLLLTNKALQAMPLRVLHRQMILLMIPQMETMLLEMRAIPVTGLKITILVRAAYPMGLFLWKIPTAA